jgi:hypothetical protein
MADVYVQVGTPKAVASKHLAAAQAAMTAAITDAVKKTGSGMTTVKPPGGKGILVNVLVTKLAQDGTNVTCNVIAELLELPSKGRFNPGGSAKGEGKVPGKIDADAGACVRAAVADLMVKIGPAIAGSQAASASTGTAQSKSPLIFIAPFDVDTKAAPANHVASTKTDITTMMEKKFKANPTRFTLNPSAFKVGSGMPAYVIGTTVDAAVYTANTKEMVATVKGYVAEHPSRSMKVTNAVGQAKQQQMIKPPTDQEKARLFVDAAESWADAAMKWILKTHP